MSYTINLTNGNILTTIPDGTINNTSCSQVLVGKNYAGYGQFLDDNFVHLLENSANSTPPSVVLTGQLWYNTTSNVLSVYNGVVFKPLAVLSNATTAPTGNNSIGDLWYDSANQQLNVWTGSSWLLIGPIYTASTGVTGAIPTTVTDNATNQHVIIELYAGGTIVGIVSKDTGPWTPSPPIAGFGTIYPGLQLSTTAANGTALFSGTATTAQTLQGLTASQVMRTDANTATSGTLKVNTAGNAISGATSAFTVGNNSDFGINISGSNAILTNYDNNGSIIFKNNVSGALTTSLTLTGPTGAVSAAGNIAGNYLLGNLSFATGVPSFGSSNISTTGNIQGNYILGNGSQLTGLPATYGNTQVAAYLPTYSGVFTASTISATGNIQGNYILGNGSQLTGLPATYGNTQVAAYLPTYSGVITAASLSASGNVQASNVSASGSIVGNSLLIYGSGNILGNLNVQGNITFINSNVITTNDLFFEFANNQSTLANINGSGIQVGNTGSSSLVNWTYSTSANAWATNVGVSAVGNITGSFFVGTATRAEYADLAECYTADAQYDPGTVVSFGGNEEITISNTDRDETVAGVISTNPAYLMNFKLKGNFIVNLALSGRVPVKVIGVINKGDRLISAGNGMARAAQPGEATAFNVIGRSLANKLNSEAGTVEASVAIK